MPTPAERRALLFVAAVATLGIAVRGVRAVRSAPVPAVDRTALAGQLAHVDSVIALGGGRQARRSRTPAGEPARAPARAQGRRPARTSALDQVPEPVAGPTSEPPRASGRSSSHAPEPPLDMDVATAAELERLPGIGPTLAARIVVDREARGPFGSAEGLQRVKGVGPALASRVRPFVTFSLPPRLSDTELSGRGGVRRP